MTTIELTCAGLSHAYQGVRALDSITLYQRGPGCVALIGANGAGKSTLLRGLVGAQRLSAGVITLNQRALYPESEARAEVGYLSEQTPLPPALSIYEVLKGSAILHKVPRKQRAGAIERVIHECNLHELSGRRCDTLSRGQRQRVGLATAIVHRPTMLVLDEVHSGLDPLQTREINAVLKQLSRTCLLVMSTHRLAAAEQIADHYWVLHQGALLHSIGHQEWLSQHKTKWSLETAYLGLIAQGTQSMQHLECSIT